MKAIDLNQSNPALDLFLVQLAGKYTKYMPEQVVFSEGDEGTTMLLVLSGSVRVIKRNPESREQVYIATRGSGEFIGEMALVEKTKRFATVIAESECEVLEFTKENFEKIIQKRPALATRVLKSLSNKLRESDSQRLTELEESNRKLTSLNRELAAFNAFLERIIDHSLLAQLLVTGDGTVVRHNRAAATMFGPILANDRTRVDDLFANFKLEKMCRKAIDAHTREAKGIRDGEEFPVYLSLTSLTDHNDEILHLITCQDMADLHTTNKTAAEIDKLIHDHRTTVDIADGMRRTLFELNQPLRVIRDQLSPEQADRLGEQFSRIHARLRDSVRNAETYLLDRYADCDFTFVDLPASLRLIVKFCRAQARNRGTDIRLETAEDFPAKLLMKAEFLQSVAASVILRAVQAVESDSAGRQNQITVRLARTEDNSFIVINVSFTSENTLLPLANSEGSAGPEGGVSACEEDSVFQVIRNVIAGHGGRFNIEKSGGNTVFSIHYPLRTSTLYG